jgi:hypothetical protein
MEAGTDVDSVTDLLALRLSSVPFHDIERPRSEDRRMSEEEARFPSETLASERWLPQLATISFVGPITSIQAALGFFSTKIPLLLPSSASHSAEASDLFALGLLLLPSSLVVGTLPQDLQQSSSNWLIVSPPPPLPPTFITLPLPQKTLHLSRLTSSPQSTAVCVCVFF